MKKEYKSPELTIQILADDVVRTSVIVNPTSNNATGDFESWFVE